MGYETMTVRELRKLASGRVRNYGKLKRDELAAALAALDATAVPAPAEPTADQLAAWNAAWEGWAGIRYLSGLPGYPLGCEGRELVADPPTAADLADPAAIGTRAVVAFEAKAYAAGWLADPAPGPKPEPTAPAKAAYPCCGAVYGHYAGCPVADAPPAGFTPDQLAQAVRPLWAIAWADWADARCPGAARAVSGPGVNLCRSVPAPEGDDVDALERIVRGWIDRIGQSWGVPVYLAFGAAVPPERHGDALADLLLGSVGHGISLADRYGDALDWISSAYPGAAGHGPHLDSWPVDELAEAAAERWAVAAGLEVALDDDGSGPSGEPDAETGPEPVPPPAPPVAATTAAEDRPAFAWPGGYPILYLTADGGTLCPDCANGRNGSRATDPDETDPAWRVAASLVHYEGPPAVCDHCGAETASAYGDPDQPEPEPVAAPKPLPPRGPILPRLEIGRAGDGWEGIAAGCWGGLLASLAWSGSYLASVAYHAAALVG